MVIVDHVVGIHHDVAISNAENVNLSPLAIVVHDSAISGGGARADHWIAYRSYVALLHSSHFVDVEEAVGNSVVAAHQRHEKALIVSAARDSANASGIRMGRERHRRERKQRGRSEDYRDSQAMMHTGERRARL